MNKPSRSEKLLNAWSPFVEWLSLEQLLTKTKRPNGGATILLRTSAITAWIYLVAITLKQALDPARTWHFSLPELRAELSATLPWIGAIFAAVYASLYTRFASQWLYLNNLYNQIKAIEARTASDSDAKPIVAAWKAGFLEDAQELHLATKPLLVSVAKFWGEDEDVKRQFVRNTPGGEERFDALMDDVKDAYARHEQELKKDRGTRLGSTSRPAEDVKSVEGKKGDDLGSIR